MSRADVVSSTLLGITTSVGLYTAFLPDLREIRKTPPSSEDARSIRMGELAAGALTIGIGITATTMVHSPMPLALSIASALAMVCMYETILNAPATTKGTTP